MNWKSLILNANFINIPWSWKMMVFVLFVNVAIRMFYHDQLDANKNVVLFTLTFYWFHPLKVIQANGCFRISAVRPGESTKAFSRCRLIFFIFCIKKRLIEFGYAVNSDILNLKVMYMTNYQKLTQTRNVLNA